MTRTIKYGEEVQYYSVLNEEEFKFNLRFRLFLGCRDADCELDCSKHNFDPYKNLLHIPLYLCTFPRWEEGVA